jgi:hypothetical protein
LRLLLEPELPLLLLRLPRLLFLGIVNSPLR